MIQPWLLHSETPYSVPDSAVPSVAPLSPTSDSPQIPVVLQPQNKSPAHSPQTRSHSLGQEVQSVSSTTLLWTKACPVLTVNLNPRDQGTLQSTGTPQHQPSHKPTPLSCWSWLLGAFLPPVWVSYLRCLPPSSQPCHNHLSDLDCLCCWEVSSARSVGLAPPGLSSTRPGPRLSATVPPKS